jgi:hypothetical protein
MVAAMNGFVQPPSVTNDFPLQPLKLTTVGADFTIVAPQFLAAVLSVRVGCTERRSTSKQHPCRERQPGKSLCVPHVVSPFPKDPIECLTS